MKKKLLPALFFVAMISGVKAEELLSPDGNVKLVFSLDEEGRPTYSMTYHGKDVIKPSHLGFELRDKVDAQFFSEIPEQGKPSRKSDLQTGFTLVDSQTSSFDEMWTPVWGE